MKTVGLFLLLPCQWADGWDCKLHSETDRLPSKPNSLPGSFMDGASNSFDADGKEVVVLISVEGADKCFDATSTAFVFLKAAK
ncbi:MAG: hypothetical protein IPP93_16185 [Chitinophagaceae bacterium]|nr:hypothetical protein [Chitinophagaceae bacterium]